MKPYLAKLGVIFLSIFVTFSQKVSADELPAYFEECKEVAISKLETKAKSKNATVTEIQLFAADLTWYKPSKYFLFKAKAVRSDGSTVELEAITQKPAFPPGECF